MKDEVSFNQLAGMVLLMAVFGLAGIVLTIQEERASCQEVLNGKGN